MTEKQENKIKGIVMVILLIITGAISTSILLPNVESTFTYKVNVFQSYDELFTFYRDIASDDYNNGGNFGGDTKNIGGFRSPELSMQETSVYDGATSASLGESTSYSSTNIQVEGVDEPDIIKTDGSYIYAVSNQKVFIIKAYPSDTSEIISTISINNFSINTIFINDQYLIIFGTPYDMPVYAYDEKMIEPSIYRYYYEPSTKIMIYDIANKEKPEIEKTIEMDGSFFNARMIGEYVYIISIQYNYDIYPLLEENESYAIPMIKVDNTSYKSDPTDIYYIDVPETIETTTHIASIDLSTMSVTQKSFLLGSSQSLYVSTYNIYLASHHYTRPVLFGTSFSGSDYEQMMIIHKISLDGTEITYVGKGEVPGRILNQFSMDEHNGFFRIATTTGNSWNEEQQLQNNIYVLNNDMEQVGEIENIAPGETIYAARFMGEKAYLVTFKKIDPFFTIDLSDPTNPQILGQLKIPGYSDYLHPYDENHVIGIGKDTVEALEEENWRTFDFAWYQGIKIALFDVSDFQNPTVLSQVVIGDRGTSSPALYDHKAFLFDKEKQLLVIPVEVYEIEDTIKEQHDNYTGSLYGDFTFQGAYVYDLSIENGFQLKGTITHLTSDDMEKSGFYPLFEKTIKRSLYIENDLYTFSPSLIKINDLTQLEEINTIKLS